MSILTQISPTVNRQVRPNLWLTESGALVGYGPMLAPTGYAFCFTCGTDECQHVQRLDEAWLAGQDSVEIPFDSSSPADSGDESTNEARLGLMAEW